MTGGGCGARSLSPGHQADPPTAWLVPPASSAAHRGLIRGSRLGDQETTGSAAHDAISYESFDISERARWIRPRSRASTLGCDRSQASPGKLSGKYFPDRKMCRLIVPVARILGSQATKPARCTRGDAQVDGGPLPPGDGRRHGPRSHVERGRLFFRFFRQPSRRAHAPSRRPCAAPTRRPRTPRPPPTAGTAACSARRRSGC